jgi:hypothetical protein
MEELLQKAKVRSLSLKEVAQVVNEPPSLDEETFKKWKVEMAVSAASEFLDEILDAVIKTPVVDKPEEAQLDAILDLRYLRPLIPVALGIVVQGGDLLEEIENLKPAAAHPQLQSSEGRKRLIEGFLPAFRRLADSVVDKGHEKVSLDDVTRLVEEYFSGILPSELFRRHIATVLADILRVIAVRRDEVEDALNQGFKNLATFYRNTLLDASELIRLGFEEGEQIDTVLTYLPVAAMLQYYLNRLVAGRAHSALLQIAGVLDEVSVGGLGSYFPLLQYIALPPAMRKERDLNVLAQQSPYEFLTTRGIVTSLGTDILSVNRGAGVRLITEMASLMGVKLELGGWVREAINRQIPGVMLRFLESLKNVLSFLRRNWSKIKDQIDPVKVPALAAIVSGLGLRGQDDETVRAVLDSKLESLEDLERIYRGNEEALIMSLPDYIMSLSEKLDWVLGHRGQEILTRINEALTEIGVYFARGVDERLEVMKPMIEQSFVGPGGGYVEVRLGLTIQREPTEGRRVKGKDVVGLALVDLANYILGGPSEGESYLDWFKKVKAGIELSLWGETSEERKRREKEEKGEGEEEKEDKAAQYWRAYGIDWKKVANDRKTKKWGAYIKPTKWWFDFFSKVEGEIGPIPSQLDEEEREKVEKKLKSVHEELQQEILEAWRSKLGNTIVSSVYGRLANLQAHYPQMLAEYIRSARAAALSSRVEMVSIEEEIPGTSGITRADTLAAEVEVGIIGRAEDMAEMVVNALVNLVSKILTEGRAESVREAFLAPEVREFITRVGDVIQGDDVLLDSIDRILNEIEAGTRRWEGLPKSFDMGEFVSVVDEEIDRILEGEQPPEPEAAAVPETEPSPPEEEETGEEVEPEAGLEAEEEEVEVMGGEEEAEAENEGRVLMKFYLLSKVLPAYSS